MNEVPVVPKAQKAGGERWYVSLLGRLGMWADHPHAFFAYPDPGLEVLPLFRQQGSGLCC